MNQKITAKDSSGVICAGNDINIGLTFQDCDRLFSLLLMENMPKLAKIAEETAIKNAQLLVEATYKKMEERIESIEINKLQEPDVQSTLNDAVQGAAKKGNKIDINVLSSLIVDRLCEHNDDYFDINLEESIKSLPKLSKELLYVLPVVYMIKYLSFQPSTVEDLELSYKALKDNYLFHCENIKGNRLITLGSLGVANYINIMGSDSLEKIEEKYPMLKGLDIQKEVPSLVYVLKKFDELELHKITPTDPGILIAAKLLENSYGKIPFNL